MAINQNEALESTLVRGRSHSPITTSLEEKGDQPYRVRIPLNLKSQLCRQIPGTRTFVVFLGAGCILFSIIYNSGHLYLQEGSKYNYLDIRRTQPTRNSVDQNLLIYKPNDDNDTLCNIPVGSVAFIKTHKTGSTTLEHIMNRFGYQRNLSFVLDKNRSNGHLVYSPISIESPKTQFLKPLNATLENYTQYKYDMITVHIRYNRQIMASFMKPKTRYITVIRNPGTQFESAFVHFQFDDGFPPEIKHKLKSTDDRLREWFRNSTVYLQNLKKQKWEKQEGLRYFYAHNNQIFDLGLDVQYHTKQLRVQEYIMRLGRELDMVLIMEYYEESLLVMKKQFCWQLEDILFLPMNQRSAKAKNYSISEELRLKIIKWNSLDNDLYQHFNRTLWRKIENYGENFTTDLQEFRQTLKEVVHNCTDGVFYRKQGKHFENFNFNVAKNSSELCHLIAEDKSSLMKKIRKRQN